MFDEKLANQTGESCWVVVKWDVSAWCLHDPPSWAGFFSTISQATNNLGLKVDTELKFDSQITAVVKSSFFQLRQLKKMKPIIEGDGDPHLRDLPPGLLQRTLFRGSCVLHCSSAISTERCCTYFNWHQKVWPHFPHFSLPPLVACLFQDSF